MGLALSAGVLVVYGRLPGFPFIGYDDNVYVYDNPVVRAGLTWPGVLWAFTSTATSNWHPLTWLSLMLDVEIGGASPRTFHLVHLLLHCANALLVYALFERMTGRSARSAAVAALFAVHPLHVESVAWIAERKDLLSTLFWLLMLLAYVRYVEEPRKARYVLVTALLACGLMAKPMLVTAPALLLVLDFWPLSRVSGSGPGRLLAEKLPWFGLAALSAVVTVLAQRQAGALGALELFPLRARLANALVAYVAYMGKTVWPVGLAIFYPYRGAALGIVTVVLATALLLAITALAIRTARARGYLLAGWLWYLITLVPVIGLVQVGLQSMADRYTYVPLLGLFVIVAWGVPDLATLLPTDLRRSVLAGLGSLAVIVLALVARRQVSYWRDGATLFRHAIEVTSENATAQNLLGSALHEAGDNQGALSHWSEAVRIFPGYVDARSNLAGALIQLGRIDEGLEQCREVLKIDPRHVKAHTNLGIVLLSLGRYEEAAEHLAASLARRPNHRETRLRLAAALANAGRLEEAAAQLQEMLRRDPRDEEVRSALEQLRDHAPGR